MTTGAQTFLDLAPLLDLVDLVIFGDSLVQAESTTLAELRTATEEWRGSAAARARQAARMVRADVESPMETRLRLLIVLAGLPEPTVNHRLCAPDGTLVCRLDLAYVEHRLGVEYDGRHHAESPDQWRRDVRRREYLDGRSWRLVVVIGQDFFADPADILRRVCDAARSVGMPMPEPKNVWRRYFRASPHGAVDDSD
ncbi:hypothetical protein [Nakamurella lactea]|uniref:hypothetical protein n=1 Tax=Nakamurella lactea TaxID=459515 RepID=UPI0012B6318E|nr:hypothetical protein [Nakamurella lactea]